VWATAPSKQRPVRLVLEELETRALLSGTGLGAWVAQPNFSVTPLSSPSGYNVYSPAQVRHAYGFDQIHLANGAAADGSGQTIAIVDAYDDPKVLADLQTFDRTFGLPNPPSFVKAMPEGQPAADAGWSGEIALDVEWAHAIAPKTNILLVEAKSASGSDLLAAVDYARHQAGVVAVSMSWGSSEFYNEQAYDGYFTTPTGHVGGSGRPGGITFVASSGDSGAWSGPDWPSVSPNVLAVGGTTLHLTSQNTYQSETGWSGSGGGYSKYETEPSFQHSAQQSGVRTTPDVAYNADPYTGFYVYDSVGLTAGQSGWWDYGGTSAGAPQWSALVALADQGRAVNGQGSLANAQSLLYSLPASDFHDITSGNNHYAATVGYDLVTGRGSPFADRVVRDLIGGASTTATTTASGGLSPRQFIGGKASRAAFGEGGDGGLIGTAAADGAFILASKWLGSPASVLASRFTPLGQAGEELTGPVFNTPAGNDVFAPSRSASADFKDSLTGDLANSMSNHLQGSLFSDALAPTDADLANATSDGAVELG
jgi:hypothetical protein